jgi:hypothetical protein
LLLNINDMISLLDGMRLYWIKWDLLVKSISNLNTRDTLRLMLVFEFDMISFNFELLLSLR